MYIKPLDVRTATYDFFVTVGVFVRANASDCAHVAGS